MKNDKIYKYHEYLKENLLDSPETYVESALRKLENRIKSMFDVDGKGDDVKKYGVKSDINRKEKGELSFSDLGLNLESLELSKYSKTQDNLKLKFSDEQFLYDITFSIDLKDAVPKDKESDFSESDIKKCQIKFKKYSTDDFQLVAGPLTKTDDLVKIDEEYLVNIKIELDETSGDEEDEFKIETE
jgi:hypothetical protein